MKTIKIAGAGPSGLAAAITLAKHGFDVKVYEAGERPKPNFRNAVHAFRNYGFEYGILEKLRKTDIKLPKFYEIKKVYKFPPSLKKVEIISKKPIFYSFMRGENKNSIDNILLKEAERHGVDIQFNRSIKEEEEVDIAATGPKRIDGVAYGYFYKNLNIDEAVYTFYDNRYAPKGYLYVLPYGKNSADIVTTSFCSPKDYPKIKNYFEKALKENKVLREITDGAEKVNRVSGYGNFNIPKTAIKNGRYYVGEAAEFQDASKGFGVKFALLSGWLAARAIIENKNYDELWKKEFLSDLIHYFKRRIAHQRATNKDFEKTIRELGEKTTKEKEEELKRKRHSKSLNLIYYYYLWKWKMFKRM